MKDDGASGGENMATMVTKMVDNLSASTSNAAAFKAQLDDINKLSKFFGDTLQPASASAYYATILKNLQVQKAEQKSISDANAAALANEGILGDIINYGRRQQLELERQANVERQKAIDLLTGQKAVSDQINSAQAREATFTSTMDKANPINDQISDVNSKIAILTGKLDRSSGKATTLTADDITALVRTVVGEAGGESAQGQLAVAAVALNRLANGNFGESLEALLKAGNGSQFNMWKPDDPTGKQNLATDSYQFQKTLQDIVLPLISKQVADPTGGALNFLRHRREGAASQGASDKGAALCDLHPQVDGA